MKYQIVDMSGVLGIVVAGGDGSRIEPLSGPRAKPAVPIGATFRIVDIVLSNLLNSLVTHAYVITQRRPRSLMRHLEAFAYGVAPMRGQFVRALPPPKDVDRFFASDADSLVQLRRVWEDDEYEFVVISMADQVVKVDYRPLVAQLQETGADALLVHRAVETDVARGNLGVLDIDGDRVRGMVEKPTEPLEIKGRPGWCHANLALYVMRRTKYLEMLTYIADQCETKSKLSHSGIPWLIEQGNVVACDLVDNIVPGSTEAERGFFADISDVDTWFTVQQLMCGRGPVFNFYDERWPMLTAPSWPMSPAKIDVARSVENVLLGWNVILQDGVSLERSIASTGCLVGRSSTVQESILLSGCRVGCDCTLQNVVVEKKVVIPDGITLSPSSPPPGTIPIDQLHARLCEEDEVPPTPVITEGGVLVIPKHYTFS